MSTILKLGTQQLPFKFRRSNRAKYLRVEINFPYILVVAPIFVDNRKIISFLLEKQRWIITHYEKIKKQFNSHNLHWPKEYLTGETIPFEGKRLELVLNFYSKARFSIFQSDKLIVNVPTKLMAEDLCSKTKNFVHKWLKTQALTRAQEYAYKYSERLKLYPKSVRVRQQKARWGSCGINNDIYLNWLLICVPTKVFEYVVVHELCHLRYRSHGVRFWGLVEKLMPDYQEYESWLKDQSNAIILP